MEITLKEKVKEQVEHLKYDNLKNYKIHKTSSDVERFVLPMHYVEISRAKHLFVENYCDPISGESKFMNNFKINKNEINRIVDDNRGKVFLHFFFCNIQFPGGNNDLGLIFRFSDLNEYSTEEELISNDGLAYFLTNNGNVIQLASNSGFIQIRDDYRKEVGEKIVIDPTTQELTEYITYEVRNLLLFKDFEHDLTFELICKEDGSSGKIRLGLAVYIEDKDRVHHVTSKQYFEGYYDAGDLKP